MGRTCVWGWGWVGVIGFEGGRTCGRRLCRQQFRYEYKRMNSGSNQAAWTFACLINVTSAAFEIQPLSICALQTSAFPAVLLEYVQALCLWPTSRPFH